MVAVVSNRDDLTADWLVLELERRGHPWVRLNTEDYPEQTRLLWTLREAVFEGAHGSLMARDVSAIWWRRPVSGQAAAGRSPQEAAWAQQEATAALQGFFAACPARWVNHPADNARAENKPEQLLRAQSLGFAVPQTLISDEAAVVRRFVDQHTRVVCKALVDGRVPIDGGVRMLPTVELDASALDGLDDLGPEPACFQALIHKRCDIRATVIGDEVLACRIDSQSQPAAEVDWRRGAVSELVHEPLDLPQEIVDRCLGLCRSYGLRFGAIDLIEDTDGQYVFLEVNANGQWAWIEQLTGLPLASRLADELMGRRK